MVRETLACHIVWTTYGTWLPGDSRGHWSAAPDSDGILRWPHGSPHPGDAKLHVEAKRKMRSAAVKLTTDEVELVAEQIGRCCDLSEWSIYAAAIQSTHVHVLQSPSSRPVVNTVKWLKDRCTRRLHEHGKTGVIWTDRSWREFVYDEDHFVRAVSYIQEHNVQCGLAASPYSWISPPSM